jgi:hypothetical protein
MRDKLLLSEALKIRGDAKMSTSASTLTDALAKIEEKVGVVAGDYPSEAHDPREELIVRYTTGTAKFSDDHRYLTFAGSIHKLNGDPDGHWKGEYELEAPIAQWRTKPAPPSPPFDDPGPPMEHVAAQAYSKATWAFGDGSSITVIGTALLYLISYIDGWGAKATQFWFSGNQIITGGTGKFTGARGLKTQGGSIYVPAGRVFPGAEEVSTVTAETFRVTRKDYIGQ